MNKKTMRWEATIHPCSLRKLTSLLWFSILTSKKYDCGSQWFPSQHGDTKFYQLKPPASYLLLLLLIITTYFYHWCYIFTSSSVHPCPPVNGSFSILHCKHQHALSLLADSQSVVLHCTFEKCTHLKLLSVSEHRHIQMHLSQAAGGVVHGQPFCSCHHDGL